MRLFRLCIPLATVLPVWAGTAEPLGGHEEYIYEISFSRDGALMASAAGDNTAMVWDVAGRKVVHVLKHDAAVYSARISPDGRTVATVGEHGKIVLWDTASWEPRVTRRPHRRAIRDVAFSPDGKRIATAGADAIVQVLDARTGLAQLAGLG